jgi:hypothetical protein
MFTNIFAARATRAVAVAAAIGLAVIAIFELLLALGVPWGRAAWGGSQEVLSPDLRMASAVAVVVWVGAALLVLGRAGYWASARWSGLLRWGTWLLVALLVLGALLNLASPSPWERFGWGPFGLVLTALCFVVARGRTERSESR